MQVMRALKKVEGKRITIELPDNFYATEVEVLVIPYEKSSSLIHREEWKKDFLSVSQWDLTEEDIRVKSWPIEEF